jgi:hypothetical protein
VSTPQTYTITETNEYSTTDGSKRFTFTAGTVIPMSLAIEMGLEGAGYDDPVWFTENEETAIRDLANTGLGFFMSWPWAATAGVANAGSANAATLMRFRLAEDVPVAKVAIGIGAQSGNVDVGFFTSDGTTATPLWRSGSTPVAAVGYQEFTPTPFTLPAGTDLYAVLAADNTVATFRVATTGASSAKYGNLLLTMASAFPLPSSFTLASGGATNRLFWIYAGPA